MLKETLKDTQPKDQEVAEELVQPKKISATINCNVISFPAAQQMDRQLKQKKLEKQQQQVLNQTKAMNRTWGPTAGQASPGGWARKVSGYQDGPTWAGAAFDSQPHDVPRRAFDIADAEDRALAKEQVREKSTKFQMAIYHKLGIQ